MKPFKLENKKRRIQKKLFLGEFAMLGFDLMLSASLFLPPPTLTGFLVAKMSDLDKSKGSAKASSYTF